MHDEAATISAVEVAAQLGFLQSSVRDAVRRGDLRPARLVDGEPYFTPAQVARYRRQLGVGATTGVEAGASPQR